MQSPELNRFSVLQSLGVEERDIKRLILKQLSIWFGLPITVAVLVYGMIVGYFLQVIFSEISAYIGTKVLFAQVSVTALERVLLLVCYFVSTWVLFQKSIEVS